MCDIIEWFPFWIPETPREIRLSYIYQYLSIRDVAENRSSLMYTDLLWLALKTDILYA